MSLYNMLAYSRSHRRSKNTHNHKPRDRDRLPVPDEKRMSGGHQRRYPSSSSNGSSKSREGHVDYYHYKEKEQFRNLQLTICSEITYHEKQILQHEQQIRLHEEAIDKHKKQINDIVQKRNNVKQLEDKYFNKIPIRRHKMERK